MEPEIEDKDSINNIDLGIDMEAVKNMVSEKKQETKEVHIAEVIETIGKGFIKQCKNSVINNYYIFNNFENFSCYKLVSA